MEQIQTAEKYAIFQTGGKQYQAIEGKTIAVEKIEGNPGEVIEFKDVLLRKLGDSQIEIGTPHLKGSIKASIVKQMQGPKVLSFRFRRRHKVRVRRGHRQLLTVVRIESI